MYLEDWFNHAVVTEDWHFQRGVLLKGKELFRNGWLYTIPLGSTTMHDNAYPPTTMDLESCIKAGLKVKRDKI